MKFHKDGTLPADPKAIFVFGSNLAGIHGAGAAKEALNHGAKWGEGIGCFGYTYAIPTKDENIVTMPLEYIKPFVKEFLMFAKCNPQLQFFVTGIGCGLAGYTPADMAPMFRGATHNCSFPAEWETFL